MELRLRFRRSPQHLRTRATAGLRGCEACLPGVEDNGSNQLAQGGRLEIPQKFSWEKWRFWEQILFSTLDLALSFSCDRIDRFLIAREICFGNVGQNQIASSVPQDFLDASILLQAAKFAYPVLSTAMSKGHDFMTPVAPSCFSKGKTCDWVIAETNKTSTTHGQFRCIVIDSR